MATKRMLPFVPSASISATQRYVRNRGTSGSRLRTLEMT